VIFLARYEASQYGSPYIETEYLPLGLLREDRALLSRLAGPTSIPADIRTEIESQITQRERISTSVGVRLTNECKKVLTLAAEEADRLRHRHVGFTTQCKGTRRGKTASRTRHRKLRALENPIPPTRRIRRRLAQAGPGRSARGMVACCGFWFMLSASILVLVISLDRMGSTYPITRIMSAMNERGNEERPLNKEIVWHIQVRDKPIETMDLSAVGKPCQILIVASRHPSAANCR
jgi:hypothetical protein